jgi:hypothetical protein
MAIVASDIQLLLSTTAGSAGFSNTSTPAGSLGKYCSTSTITDNVSNNVFPNITGDQNAGAPYTDYSCVFVLNNHATLPLQNAVVYLSSQVSGGADITIATDNIAASAKGGSSAQAANIANSTTAPTGTSSFSAPTTKGAGLSLGTINAGQVKGIWVKRNLASTVSAQNADGATIAVAGDTAA